MTAIWPAGPPKLRAAMRSQTPTASAKGMACGWPRARRRRVERKRSLRGFRVRPVVGFPGRVAAPAVERVVEGHAGLELREVVGVHPRQAERNGEQSGGFRREVGPCRVGAANDACEALQRLGSPGRTPRP